MKVVIYKSTGSWYLCKDEEGNFWNGRIKGKLKVDAITSTNPIAVGDYVEATVEDMNEKTVSIHRIYDRNNYLVRQSPHNKNQKHIVASNIDQSILLATLKQPRTSLGFIDRFIISNEMFHIPIVLVFNKMDLYNTEEMACYNQYKHMYEKIGYNVLLVSITQNQNIEELKNILEGKRNLLTGHSGVGKSSLLKLLNPNREIKTATVSEWSGKGTHTTTFAEMFDADNNTTLIDTPGIKELGLIDVNREELSGYFKEFRQYINLCKYHNCVHIDEPECAVKNACNEGHIEMARYDSYIKLYNSIEKKW